MMRCTFMFVHMLTLIILTDVSALELARRELLTVEAGLQSNLVTVAW